MGAGASNGQAQSRCKRQRPNIGGDSLTRPDTTATLNFRANCVRDPVAAALQKCFTSLPPTSSFCLSPPWEAGCSAVLRASTADGGRCEQLDPGAVLPMADHDQNPFQPESTALNTILEPTPTEATTEHAASTDHSSSPETIVPVAPLCAGDDLAHTRAGVRRG